MYRIVITKEEEKDIVTQEYEQLYDTQDAADSHGKPSMYGYVDKSERKTVSTQVLDQRAEDVER